MFPLKAHSSFCPAPQYCSLFPCSRTGTQLGEMHSCLVELGAAGYIPVFETYQLLFILPFVSVCNSARLGFFVSLSPQTVPRIRITEASDLLQSYLFNEMHALLPYVPKRLLSGRKGLPMPLQDLFILSGLYPEPRLKCWEVGGSHSFYSTPCTRHCYFVPVFTAK